MKRLLVLRAACAIVGTAFSVLACSSSNPTLPPWVTPLDSGLDERVIIQQGTEAGALDASALDSGGASDARDVAKDSPQAGPGSGPQVPSAALCRRGRPGPRDAHIAERAQQNRIAHGYIFSGHRGIGKTTIARILARR